jgi:DNA-binding LytR/AlgR family response regulator
MNNNMVFHTRGRSSEPLSSTVPQRNDGNGGGEILGGSSAQRELPPLPLTLRSSFGVEANPSAESQETTAAAAVERTLSVRSNLLIGERDRRLYVLRPEKIDYIESDGNYVKFHVGNTEYITRGSVKRLATTMAGSGFVRIERSLLVNVRAISYLQRAGRGTYAFTLVSGACLHSGAKYRDQILRVLPLA